MEPTAKPTTISPLGMAIDEFRRRGKEMIDRVADYYESVEKYRVSPAAQPGFLRPYLPARAPDDPEPWDSILADFDQFIMPGITHWQSPNFHAYFPAQTSFPAFLGEMLSNMINAIGFSWIGCPAMTELEIIVMDWLSEALGLPTTFLSKSGGGGVIQGTASEAVLVAVFTARHAASRRGQETDKLSAYLTSQRHASCDKALRLAGIRHVRVVEGAEQLAQYISEDLAQGLYPFFAVATIGYTGTAAYDDIEEIGAVCSRDQPSLHLHIDAAYAGSALLCPEYRYMSKGIDHASSFNFNPHKWMLTNFDCSAYFVRDSAALQRAMSSDMEIYGQEIHDQDRRNWGVPLGRRFRALKLWFVMRTFGISGLQANIRRQCSQAQRFEEHVLKDPRFELFCPRNLGLVCFRLKPRNGDAPESTNDLNLALINLLNAEGSIILVHSSCGRITFIRFTVCSPQTTDEHIDFAWERIREAANRL